MSLPRISLINLSFFFNHTINVFAADFFNKLLFFKLMIDVFDADFFNKNQHTINIFAADLFNKNFYSTKPTYDQCLCRGSL